MIRLSFLTTGGVASSEADDDDPASYISVGISPSNQIGKV